MSYCNITIHMGEIAHELFYSPSKLSYLLNEITCYRDNEQGNRFVNELIEDLDPATKRMISTIAKAIEAEAAAPVAMPEQRASTADLDQADRFPRAVQSRRPVPPPEGDAS